MSAGRVFVLFWLAVAGARQARAGWPYLTEEATTLGPGRVSLAAGISRTFQDSAHLPGGRGALWRLPEVQGTLGIGPRAEISFQYEMLLFEPLGESDFYYESGDLRLLTKVGLLKGDEWATGLRFGVKVPNAANEHKLGTDETDFLASLLWDSQLGMLRLSVNAGIGILGSTTMNQSQDDVFTWGVALRAPVGDSLSLGLEGAGMAGPWGIRVRRNFAEFAAVATWTGGPWGFALSGRRGVVDALGWGVVAGVTYER